LGYIGGLNIRGDGMAAIAGVPFLLLLLQLVLVLGGACVIVLAIVLGLKAYKALDIYISKNQGSN
jgi:hypothetical protein